MRSDEEMMQMLTDGRPAGASLDRMWENIAPRALVRPPLWQRIRLPLLGAVPALAAASALVFFVARPESVPQPRGDEKTWIEATCGGSDNPCRVGRAFGLRFIAPEVQGIGYVFLQQQGADPTLIAGPVMLDGPGQGTVPARLTPEADDATRGSISLLALVLPREVSVDDARRLALQEGRVTRLKVQP